jgi:hypothetical protein
MSVSAGSGGAVCRIVRYQRHLEVFVRRRICVAVTLIGAALLGVGSTVASAAPAGSPVVLRCGLSMSVTPGPGSNMVNQPPSDGAMYGPHNCRTAGYGRGIVAARFMVPESGDLVGTYTQYFHAGTLTGKFDLVPQEGGQVSQNFLAQTWVGKVTVTGGTGIYAAVKGLKGGGVMKCASPDTVHLACKERVKVNSAG